MDDNNYTHINDYSSTAVPVSLTLLEAIRMDLGYTSMRLTLTVVENGGLTGFTQSREVWITPAEAERLKKSPSPMADAIAILNKSRDLMALVTRQDLDDNEEQHGEDH